jgi:hypothetical protein
MVRILMLAGALLLAFTAPAASQKKITVEQALAQLYGLCDRDYKPACIKLGLVIGRIPPKQVDKLRRAHPEWWWWERW